MSFDKFLASEAPSPDLGAPLAALWHDAHGDWDRAHACVQDDGSRDGAWVHAYLHRREGDDANARYWYTRAGKKPPAAGFALDAERAAIGAELLGAREKNQ